MRDLELSIETRPALPDIDALGRGLNEHALPTTGTPGFQPLAAFARNESGSLVGGVYAQLNWTWLHISLFWISTERRRQGLGSKLLGAIEAAALERGCAHSHLDTFSYQARPFYERHGYRVFAILEDYPPGHQRIFLRKPLRS
jgi:GNAT superfamily N-acetyltransferase